VVSFADYAGDRRTFLNPKPKYAILGGVQMLISNPFLVKDLNAQVESKYPFLSSSKRRESAIDTDYAVQSPYLKGTFAPR